MHCPSCNGELTNIYMRIGDVYEVIQKRYICQACHKIIKFEYKELQ